MRPALTPPRCGTVAEAVHTYWCAHSVQNRSVGAKLCRRRRVCTALRPSRLPHDTPPLDPALAPSDGQPAVPGAPAVPALVSGSGEAHMPAAFGVRAGRAPGRLRAAVPSLLPCHLPASEESAGTTCPAQSSASRAQHPTAPQVVHIERLAARQAAHAPPATPLAPPVAAALQLRGVRRLFTHQAAAMDHLMQAGRRQGTSACTAAGAVAPAALPSCSCTPLHAAPAQPGAATCRPISAPPPPPPPPLAGSTHGGGHKHRQRQVAVLLGAHLAGPGSGGPAGEAQQGARPCSAGRLRCQQCSACRLLGGRRQRLVLGSAARFAACLHACTRPPRHPPLRPNFVANPAHTAWETAAPTPTAPPPPPPTPSTPHTPHPTPHTGPLGLRPAHVPH